MGGANQLSCVGRRKYIRLARHMAGPETGHVVVGPTVSTVTTLFCELATRRHRYFQQMVGIDPCLVLFLVSSIVHSSACEPQALHAVISVVY